MITAYLTAMRRYVTFSGRASRAEFWWFVLVMNVICFVALVLDVAFISGPDTRTHTFAGVVILAHILPSLAVAVRRLHDVDRSGLFLCINVFPIIGIVILVVVACQAGTPGPNRFGPAVGPGLAPAPGLAGAAATTVVAGAAPAAAVPYAGPRDVVGEIERLAQLRADGSLSEAEFEAMKGQALGRG